MLTNSKKKGIKEKREKKRERAQHKPSLAVYIECEAEKVRNEATEKAKMSQGQVGKLRLNYYVEY